MAANIRQSSYSDQDIRGNRDAGVFGSAYARLPTPPMLMIDRILHVADNDGAFGRGSLTAELDIHPDLWFFSCHFPGDPVMPGCLGLDALWQLLGFYLAWREYPGYGRALGVDEVKFFGQVLPSAHRVTYHLDIKRVIARKLVMGIGDGSLAVDGEPIYTARNLRVGLFQTGEGLGSLRESSATVMPGDRRM